MKEINQNSKRIIDLIIDQMNSNNEYRNQELFAKKSFDHVLGDIISFGAIENNEINPCIDLLVQNTKAYAISTRDLEGNEHPLVTITDTEISVIDGFKTRQSELSKYASHLISYLGAKYDVAKHCKQIPEMVPGYIT